MRTIFTALTFLAVFASGTRALTADDTAANAQVQAAASGLIREDKTPEAQTYLATNLHFEADATPHDFAIAQCFISIAFDFKNRRDAKHSSFAARAAKALVDPLLTGTSFPPVRANLFYNMGYACEMILRDQASAVGYYNAALVLQPANAEAQERLAQLKRKKTS